MVVLFVVVYGFSYMNDRQVFLQYMNGLIVLYLLLLHAIHFDYSVLVAFLHCHQQIVSSDHDFSHFQMHSPWHHSYNHLQKIAECWEKFKAVSEDGGVQKILVYAREVN